MSQSRVSAPARRLAASIDGDRLTSKSESAKLDPLPVLPDGGTAVLILSLCCNRTGDLPEPVDRAREAERATGRQIAHPAVLPEEGVPDWFVTVLALGVLLPVSRDPTTWLFSLTPFASLLGSPMTPRSRLRPPCHRNACRANSTYPNSLSLAFVSAHPVIAPRSLSALASLFGPPNVPRSISRPFRRRKA